MDSMYVGRWLDSNEIPTIEEIRDTYNAILEQPTEFDYDVLSMVDLAAERFNVTPSRMGELILFPWIEREAGEV